MHKTKKRKRKLYEKIAALCEIPQESVADIPIFVIRGRHEVEVEGCTGILEYDSEKIVLAVDKSGRGKFTVTGDMLTLNDFSNRLLFVRGNIASVSFVDTESSSKEDY